MKVTAIILAGGKSKRMGENKALVPLLGKPLIRYSIDLAVKFTADILISANNRDLDHFGFPVIRDVVDVKAPLAGIHAGLLASATDWNLVLTCDMPNVSVELIRLLLNSLDDSLRMVVPCHDEFLEPLCGFYHKRIIPVMESNMKAGKLSMLDLPGLVPHRLIEIKDLPSDEITWLFRNMNERGDLPE
jgi:molybdopterin-guanine dinucleotide biosynthesis protein A